MSVNKFRVLIEKYPAIHQVFRIANSTWRQSGITRRKLSKRIEDLFFGLEHYEARQMSKSIGYKPDLKNPRTFNEKIAYLKINKLIPNASSYADKILVRKYISELGLPQLLPRVYETFKEAGQYNPQDLPNEYVVKANFGSGTNIIIDNRSILNPPQVVLKLKGFNSVLTDFFFSNEHHYLEIDRAFLVEEYLTEGTKESLTDYKFHCARGRVFLIQVDIDRFQNHSRMLLDNKWNQIPAMLYYPTPNKGLQIPDNKEELVKIASLIAGKLPYCRVDLYNLDFNRIVFGEITLTPGGNCENFTPLRFDRLLGDEIDLDDIS